MSILASVIVTSYNYRAYLAVAIESALAQKYPNVEVIVVDDGSVDGSQEIIAAYGTRITSICKDNGGQASAFNAGFRASHGNVVCFLDSDDCLDSTAIERVLPSFSDSATVQVHWPLRIISRDGRETGGVLPKRGPAPVDLREASIRDGPFYDWNYTTPTSGNAWARSFLDLVMPLPEREYRVGPDAYLLTLAPVLGRVTWIPDSLGRYRAHGANNGWGRSMSQETIAEDLRRFESCSAALAGWLGKQGIPADLDGWRQRNINCRWIVKLQAAREELASVIPTGESMILVDDCDLGEQPFADRTAIPFLEKAGQYWGPPTDDATAIRELERLRKRAGFLVLWWTSFWWLECYAGFFHDLRSRYQCVLDNERIVIFDLRN